MLKLLRYTHIVFIIVFNLDIDCLQAQESVLYPFKSCIELDGSLGAIQYEHRIKEANSLVLSYGNFYRDWDNPDISKSYIAAEFRHYFAKDRPWPYGFHLGFYCIYKDFYFEEYEQNQLSVNRLVAIGPGVNIGFHVLDDKFPRWPLSYNFGIGYNLYKNKTIISGIDRVNSFTMNFNLYHTVTIGFLFNKNK
jgi:hypothetical protein